MPKVGNVVWVLQQILYAFQQCTNFENWLTFDKVTESLMVGTFLRHSAHKTHKLKYRSLKNIYISHKTIEAKQNMPSRTEPVSSTARLSGRRHRIGCNNGTFFIPSGCTNDWLSAILVIYVRYLSLSTECRAFQSHLPATPVRPHSGW